jgi:hypothetical protein
MTHLGSDETIAWACQSGPLFVPLHDAWQGLFLQSDLAGYIRQCLMVATIHTVFLDDQSIFEICLPWRTARNVS